MNIPLHAFGRENLHYWATGVLALAAVPILEKLGLPLRFDWIHLSGFYWLRVGPQSIFAAGILFLIGFPAQHTARSLLQKVRREPLRLILILLFALVLLLLTSWGTALIVTVDTIAVLEWRERSKKEEVWHEMRAIALPAIYLFLGLVLVSTYNMIIVSVRFFAAYDTAFYNFDLWLLHGMSVSAIVHQLGRSVPGSVFHFLEIVYLGMFAQVGACLILVSREFGERRGMRFVGTIMIAYYITLAVFFIWPSHGPYYLCLDHFRHFPSTLFAYSAQKFEIASAQALWNHVPPASPPFLYFIAFPCMHITQPLIVLWYVRKWKRMAFILALYDVVLVVAIVGLEWHYVADLIGGIGVAALAVLATDAQQMWFATRQGRGQLAYDGKPRSESCA